MVNADGSGCGVCARAADGTAHTATVTNAAARTWDEEKSLMMHTPARVNWCRSSAGDQTARGGAASTEMAWIVAHGCIGRAPMSGTRQRYRFLGASRFADRAARWARKYNTWY